MCNRAANPDVCLLVPDADDLVDVLLGGRVESDDAAVEGLEEKVVFLLRTRLVHDVNPVVVRIFKVF